MSLKLIWISKGKKWWTGSPITWRTSEIDESSLTFNPATWATWYQRQLQGNFSRNKFNFSCHHCNFTLSISEGEDWDAIFVDIERVIMPGVTHVHKFVAHSTQKGFSNINFNFSVAKSTHARVLPSAKLFSISAWWHAGRCHKLLRIYLGINWVVSEL